MNFSFESKQFFLGLSGLILLVMLALSLNVGVNEDDKYQEPYSEMIMDYYLSGGDDTAALKVDKGNMHFYGGFYEIFAGTVNRTLGLKVTDVAYHDVRHLLIAFFGWLAIVFTALLAREIAGWRAGVLTLVLMFVSPRFLGHSFINPKDIPYAAGFAIGLFFLVRLLKNMPNPNWKSVAGLAVGIGMALGTRAGGLLLIAYVGAFAGLHFVIHNGIAGLAKDVKLVIKYITYFGVGIVGGYILGVLTWPAALQAPLSFPLKALTEFEQFSIGIRLLFEGGNIMSDASPWYYAPLWMVKTMPLFTLLGLVGSLVLLPKIFKSYDKTVVMLLWFSALFPIVYVIYQDANLYDGWRHLIFVYPPMVILTSLFWLTLEKNLVDNNLGKKIALVILALLIIEPAVFIARNTPYPYVYFNPIAGGASGAFGQYEMDYWGTSCRQAVDWLEEQGIIGENQQDTVILGTTFYYATSRAVPNLESKKVKIRYVRFGERYTKDWDYGIFPSRFFRGAHLQSGNWPNSRTIHTITTNGVPLTAIEKNESKDAYRGEVALKNRDFLAAITAFEQEAKAFSDNELAYIGLMKAYLNTRRYDDALAAGEQALTVAPQNQSALLLMGLAYLNKNNTSKAMESLNSYIKLDKKNAAAYYYLALTYQARNDIDEALSQALKAIKVNPRFKQAYTLVANIYQQKGDTNNAARYQNAAAKL